MTARRYEISLLVYIEKYFSTRCSVYNINTNEIPNHCKKRNLLCNHNNGDLFTCEENMLFSHDM